MAKYSKQANDLIKRANESHNVYLTNGKEIAASNQTIFDEASPKKPHVDVHRFLEASDSLVLYRKENLEKADILVIRELGEDEAALNGREEKVRSTRLSSIRVRHQLAGIYGEEFPASLGLGSSLPEDATQLHRILKSAADVLSAPKNPIKLPEPLDPFSPKWEQKALVKILQQLSGSLQEAVDTATQERKETQDAKRKRRVALESLHRAVLSQNALLEQFARLAGLNDIANRIRPRGGRPSPSEQQEPTSTPTTPSVPS